MEMNLYSYWESRSPSQYTRKCIDGSVTGCNKCVGYCQYAGHPGFITQKHRLAHRCIEKNCFYYIGKPCREKTIQKVKSSCAQILTMAEQYTQHMDGIKVIDAIQEKGCWQICYVTITKECSFNSIEGNLSQELNCDIIFTKLNYDFGRCVQLILAG